MTTETITINDSKYEINYDGILSLEQKELVKKQILQTCPQCTSDITALNNVNNIKTMASPVNLLVNPGFEIPSYSDPTSPQNWYKWNTNTTGTYSYPEIGNNEIGSSVKINCTTTEVGKVTAYVQNISTNEFKKYKLSGYIKAENVSSTYKGIRLGVDWKAQTTYIGESNISITKTGSYNWTYFEGEITAPATATIIAVLCSLDNSSGSAWFDDLSLIELKCAQYKNTGDHVALTAKGHGGTAPYTITFKRAGIALPNGIFTGVLENEVKTFDYVVTTSDKPLLTLSSDVADSCSGSITCSDSCTISVGCPLSSCEFTAL